MDKSLGDVLDHIEKLGVSENTLVIFLGDNGTDAPLGHQHAVACAAPLRGKKGSHYEGGIRVPFIAAWAKPSANNSLQQRFPIAHGSIQTQVSSVCDLLPTLAQVTNVPVPDNHMLDGQSLWKLFAGQADADRAEQFLMHYPHSPHRTDYFTLLRDGDWKVIYHYFPSEVSADSHYQLYNLSDDPFEQNELSAKEPEQLRRMVSRLAQELKRHHAAMPVDQQDRRSASLCRKGCRVYVDESQVAGGRR